eukprot:TRINITY_DN1224_c0_g3_i1.p1 TRINITY_DN1224_c0_g3~~TRINITY_DN1224_c0_g3_i1.p1  ORF type:complete len:281 (+),score=30.90 TRINITY_DN1224_c0_g3_i1:94-936(+)
MTRLYLARFAVVVLATLLGRVGGDDAVCKDLKKMDAECTTGYDVAELAVVEECQTYLCENVLGPTDAARCSDTEHYIAGSAYGCRILAWNDTVIPSVICKARPPPPAVCSTLTKHIETTTASIAPTCPPKFTPVTTNILTECSPYICTSLLTEWDIARGIANNTLIKGNGYQCQVTSWTGVDEVGITICTPHDDSGSSKLSDGTVLLIIFFSTLTAYCFLGVLVNLATGESGLDLIPNRMFWSSLPGLVYDGALFLACRKRRRYEIVESLDPDETLIHAE